MSQAPGQVVPFDRSNVPAVRKEEYFAAIQLWCENRNTAEALTREEIGAMKAFDRIDAQRKAIILNLAHYYRKHDRADVAPGLSVVITLLSDNEKGASTVSQPVLAKLFGRSLSSIGEAIKRLRKDEIIITSRGRYAATYPVIPRAVTTSYNHLTWLVSAVCEHDKPLNLPGGPVDCQSTGETGGLNQCPDGSGGLKKLNPPVEGNSIHRGDRCQLHYKNSTTLNRAASVVAKGIATALGSLPAAAHPTEPPAIHQPAKPSLADLTERMMDAAGPALANPAGAAGLLMFSEQQMWLSNGCDLEADILPTIRALSARQPNGSIKSWRYFTQAIADAKAARIAPMPEGRAPIPRNGTNRKKTVDEMSADEYRDYLERGGV